MRPNYWLLFAFLCTVAHSQTPPSAPAKTAQGDQRKAAPEEKKGTRDQQSPAQPSSGSDQSRTAPASENQEKAGAEDQIKTSPDWWAKASTALVTIFTGALAYLAYLQWTAMNRQAEHMREALGTTKAAADAATRSAETATSSAEVAERTMRLTERADVLVDSVELTNPQILIGSNVLLRLRNYGRTRANSMQVDCHYGLRGSGIQDGFQPGFVGKRPIYVLGGGAELSFTTRHTVKSICGDNFGRIFESEDRAFRVWGKVTYADIFNEQHVLEFTAVLQQTHIFMMEDHQAS